MKTMKTSLGQFIQVDKGLQRVHVRQKLFRQIRHIPNCSSNNWVKLRWQPKLPMALNGLKDQQSCLSVFVAYLTISSSN